MPKHNPKHIPARVRFCFSAAVRSLLLFWLLATAGFLFAAEFEFDGVETVHVIGDIHGDYDNYRQVLRDAGITNRRGNWVAGNAHLVQLGDVPDRGPDTLQIIEHLKKLATQAQEDGGHVHVLIGNHEAMNMLGDLRYVHPGEFDAFRSRQSRELRERYYAANLARAKELDPEFVETDAYREQFEERFPLGYVEHRIAWAPDGEIGQWVASHNAIIRINDSLFLHGGVSPAMLGMSLAEINAQVSSELTGGLGEEQGLVEREDGPLWYRGLASNAEELEAEHLQNALTTFGVNRIVVGHTPGMGTIVPRFAARVLIVDAGMAEYYGAHRASLLIEGATLTTIQNGEHIPLPQDPAGLLPYYQNVMSVAEGTDALRAAVEELEAQPAQ